ncbi:MAG: biotin--[acetyl-CoA-carboxylase] ligase [Dehalococcoidales bacterium]|nr:biotin--[acetyl-CoA-carboxylase] ligase [Dehalococcoidales bacterium]
MTEQSLFPELIQRELKTRFIGQKVIYYPVVDSTMEAAKREAIWGAEAGTVIIAGEQTAGRGRLNRTWVSPQGGLAMSVILRPNSDYIPYLIMFASLAVTYSLRVLTGLRPQIKWPNDVLINDKKVCGILIENDIRKNTLKHTIIGIGINVNIHIPDYPEIASIATSLSDQLGREIPRLDVARHLLVEMDRLYQLLSKNDFILEQWKRNLITIGQKVQVTMGDMVYQGTAESVTGDGSLMLRQKDGSLKKIIAGDVNLA